MKIAFFDSKEYDKVSFDKVNNGKFDIYCYSDTEEYILKLVN